MLSSSLTALPPVLDSSFVSLTRWEDSPPKAPLGGLPASQCTMSLWTLDPRPRDTARTSLDEICRQWDAALRRLTLVGGRSKATPRSFLAWNSSNSSSMAIATIRNTHIWRYERRRAGAVPQFTTQRPASADNRRFAEESAATPLLDRPGRTRRTRRTRRGAADAGTPRRSGRRCHLTRQWPPPEFRRHSHYTSERCPRT
jgi:hypothetical protein